MCKLLLHGDRARFSWRKRALVFFYFKRIVRFFGGGGWSLASKCEIHVSLRYDDCLVGLDVDAVGLQLLLVRELVVDAQLRCG